MSSISNPIPADQRVRVLIVEDSPIQRKMIRTVFEAEPRIDVVGNVGNGELALARLAAGEVDVLTLDLEMPVLDGVGVLEYMRDNHCDAGAIVVSASSGQGAKKSIEAMSLGAFDFIVKPAGGSGGPEDVVARLRELLLPRVLACADYVRQQGGKPRLARTTITPRPALPSARTPARTSTKSGRADLVVLGSSTGGPQALEKVLPQLPADFEYPVLVVQHMPPMFTKSLAENLDKKCPLRVLEATHGQVVQAGEILIAPGGSQMRLAEEAGRRIVQLTDDPRIKSCRPSVDYLFRSAARISGGNTLAVILTGMGDDGTDGARLLVDRGAHLIVQDEATSVVFGMPRTPAVEGWADEVLPLPEIGSAIVRSCRSGVRS